jgi:hypothetical protein
MGVILEGIKALTTGFQKMYIQLNLITRYKSFEEGRRVPDIYHA